MRIAVTWPSTVYEFFIVLSGFVRRPRVRGAVVHDARITAICVAHGVEALLSRDRDFSLFPELGVCPKAS